MASKRVVLACVVALGVLIPAFADAQIVANGQGWPGVTPPVFGGPSSGVTGSGIVIAPQLLAPDGSASAPSYSFASQPGDGIYSGGANVVALGAGDRLAFGGASASEPAIRASGADIEIRLADNSARGNLLASIVNATTQYNLNGTRVMASTAPTVSSGFGTSPSITANGTAAFRINVGTGGTASSGVFTMPTAATGWNCHVDNLTALAANRANQRTAQTSSTTTSVTIQNQTISTGAALAWTASDVVALACVAY